MCDQTIKAQGRDIMPYVVGSVAASMAVFHLITAYVGNLPTLQQVYVHLGFIFTLIFLTKPVFGPKYEHHIARWVVDGGLVVLTITSCAFIVYNFNEISLRGSGNPTPMTVYMGIVATLLILEGTRRMIGLALPIIALVFIWYAYFGEDLPGILSHRPLSLNRIVTTFYISTNGIPGAPAQVSSTYIAVFVIFAAFLESSGVGKFFIDWSYAALAWFRGGAAKVAVVGSSLMGAINGSAVANTVSTGTFTIPLMKRSGLRGEQAAAVEAAASSGGQLAPPVMGAAAFIMAQITGIPYGSIMIGAAVPALLYYLAIFFMIDFDVAVKGIKGIPKKELPSASKIFIKNWFLAIPLVILVWLLVVENYSPIKSALYAIITAFILSFVTKHNKLTPKRLMRTLQAGGLSMLEVAAACACAGLILGVLTLSGLALQLSAVLIELSGGNIMVLLLLTAIVSLILGMGLPTSAVYIILAALVAPALTQLGIPLLAAHLFVFYFGVLANVTPPVALAAYAGAAIAKANPTLSGIFAFRLTLSGFIIPFIWAYDPDLIFTGDVVNTGIAIFWAIAMILALSIVLTGYFFGVRAKRYQRILLLISALLLIEPGTITNAVGVGILLLTIASRYLFGGHTIMIQQQQMKS